VNIRNKDVKLNWKNDKWKQKLKCKKYNFCFINRDRKTFLMKRLYEVTERWILSIKKLD
jgi:hypothetical protein